MFSAEAEISEEGATYWITVRGGGSCSNLTQYAALQYLPTNFSLAEDLPDPDPIPTPALSPSKVRQFQLAIKNIALCILDIVS